MNVRGFKGPQWRIYFALFAFLLASLAGAILTVLGVEFTIEAEHLEEGFLSFAASFLVALGIGAWVAGGRFLRSEYERTEKEEAGRSVRALLETSVPHGLAVGEECWVWIAGEAGSNRPPRTIRVRAISACMLLVIEADV